MLEQLRESNQALQTALQDAKTGHQMTQLRADKQEERNQRELAEQKAELADMRKLMDTMISSERHERKEDILQKQNQAALV